MYVRNYARSHVEYNKSKQLHIYRAKRAIQILFDKTEHIRNFRKDLFSSTQQTTQIKYKNYTLW